MGGGDVWRGELLTRGALRHPPVSFERTALGLGGQALFPGCWYRGQRPPSSRRSRVANSPGATRPPTSISPARDESPFAPEFSVNNNYDIAPASPCSRHHLVEGVDSVRGSERGLAYLPQRMTALQHRLKVERVSVVLTTTNGEEMSMFEPPRLKRAYDIPASPRQETQKRSCRLHDSFSGY